MNKFNYTITAFDENIDDIAIRLGDCQHYSDKITDKMLRDAGIDIENRIDIEKDTLKFFQLICLIKQRKALKVTVYCIKEKNLLHVYSDFFTLEDAFSDAFSFFDDLDNVLLMIEKRESAIIADLIKHGEKIFHFTVSIHDDRGIEHISWQQSYMELYNTMDGLPSACDIACSLDFILQNSSKTDNQMRKYLNQNALIKTEYIL